MKKYQIYVGIDVSKRSLDVCYLRCEPTLELQHQVVTNNKRGIRSILRKLSQMKVVLQQVLFCFEDTGIYGIPLCYQLQERSLDFAMVPAIHIKRSKGLKRGKSDRSDAKDIAEYAFTYQHQLSLYQLPEGDLQQLKLLLAEREKLVKALSMFSATTETTDFLDKKIVAQLQQHTATTIDLLKKQLVALEREIKALIAANQQMKQQVELLQSIPGVGPQTALQLISYTHCFTRFGHWRQLACYAGIAPFEYQSGTSIRGKTKVSHFAQKKLKSLLSMAALTAKKHDQEMKEYFDRKVKEGKNKMSVLNAVRCKIVSRAFAVIRRGTPFVNLHKFAA